MTSLRASALAPLIVATLVGVGGCSIQVDKDEHQHKANVDIRTLGGDLSVKGGLDAPDTGLTPYPGATPTRSDDGDEKEAADVHVNVPFVNVHVVAAKYESSDAPAKILDFYRDEMKKFGEVLECSGNIDFKNGRMVCRSGSGRSDEIQLGAGTERRHHIVAVKPRGTRSELSLVSIETSGTS